jgi:hypothetical protein
MAINQNHIIGSLCVVAGIVIIIVSLGNLLVRVAIALAAFSLINYGLKLRGLPPLQMLIPMMARRNRWM